MGEEDLRDTAMKLAEGSFVCPDQMALPDGGGGLLVGDGFMNVSQLQFFEARRDGS